MPFKDLPEGQTYACQEWNNMSYKDANNYIKQFCEDNQVSLHLIKGHKRSLNLVILRAKLVKVLKDFIGLSFPEIAARLNRTSPAIIYLYKKKI